jgi:hypothetical protein
MRVDLEAIAELSEPTEEETNAASTHLATLRAIEEQAPDA